MTVKRKRYLSLAAVLGLILLGLGRWGIQAGAAQQGQTLRLYLPIVQQKGLPPPDEATSKISVPAGFAIRIFATVPGAPRLMTVGPDGWIYVALMGSGQIARLPDQDHNGLADGVEIVASGLNQPHDLEWYNGWMYVAENDKIERLADQNKDGIYETRQLITNNIPGAGGHSSRTLHFGPDGKLYATAGSSCNVCVETDPRRAAMLRFNPDGSIPSDNPFVTDPDVRKRPVWAWGMRNAVDFLWTPSGALWASTMGTDGLGDNVPPEVMINVVQKGGWYGWPYCYNPKLGLNQPAQSEVPDPSFSPPPGVNCGQAIPALLTDVAHSAPIGMSLAANSSFPTDFKDDLFIAQHGSWNTSAANYRDCKVERVIIQNGSVVGSETFANGWRAPGKPCGDAATWGRPAGITFGSDGALYISDDAGGRVYRVVYIGK